MAENQILNQLATLGVNALQQQQAKSGNTRAARAFFTDPNDGLQTIAGKALASINSQYLALRDSGQNSADLILQGIAAVERVRATFAGQVAGVSAAMRQEAGNGALVTINGVAAQQTAAFRAELAKLPAAAGGVLAAGLGSIGGDSMVWLVVVGLILLAFFFLGRKG